MNGTGASSEGDKSDGVGLRRRRWWWRGGWGGARPGSRGRAAPPLPPPFLCALTRCCLKGFELLELALKEAAAQTVQKRVEIDPPLRFRDRAAEMHLHEGQLIASRDKTLFHQNGIFNEPISKRIRETLTAKPGARRAQG